MAVSSSRRPWVQARKTPGREITPGITRHCQSLEKILVRWLPSLHAMASSPLIISRTLNNLPSVASRKALVDSNLLLLSPPSVVSRILPRDPWAINRTLPLPMIINKAWAANLPLVTHRTLVDNNRLVINTNKALVVNSPLMVRRALTNSVDLSDNKGLMTSTNLAQCQAMLVRGNPTTRGSNPQILALCTTSSSQDNLKPLANAGKETLNKIKVSRSLVRIRLHSRIMGSLASN